MSVLLVGNGINRYAGIVPGWYDLFANAVKVDGFHVKRSLSPTLEYELNTQTILDADRTKKPNDIKRDIATYLTNIQKTLPKDWDEVIHKKLMEVAPPILLTTNYDYFLELAADPDFKLGRASTRETLYSKERFRESNGHRIYHIHDELSAPSSICLGYEHYVGSIQHIRSELTKSAAEKENQYHLYAVLKGYEKPISNRWYYHFFTDDLYILGFGLDASEQDIWWLLNYRADQMRTHPGLITNKIIYLETSSPDDLIPRQTWEDIKDDKAKIEEYLKDYVRYTAHKQVLEQKRTLLEAFHVHVEDCTSPDDMISGFSINEIYARRYQRALDELRGGRTK